MLSTNESLTSKSCNFSLSTIALFNSSFKRDTFFFESKTRSRTTASSAFLASTSLLADYMVSIRGLHWLYILLYFNTLRSQDPNRQTNSDSELKSDSLLHAYYLDEIGGKHG